ncbi:unnamed protein product [Closterium sp. NIES-65]|nr:unnamed protein product [Closterium sp. NIES-65]
MGKEHRLVPGTSSREAKSRGRAAGEQQARGAPGRAAEAGKVAEGSLEEKGRGGRDEATALLAALHLPVKSLFLIFVPHLCLLRIVHTPCFLFAPETFATGLGQPHKPQTLPLTQWPFPSIALPVEGRGGGQHRRFLTPLPCGRAGTCGDGREAALTLVATRESIGVGLAPQGVDQLQVTPSGVVAPPCSHLANSLLALALSPFLPSLPTDQLCVCALQVEGRGGGQHRRYLTPLPCGRVGTRGDGREAALPVAATGESIGVGLASQGTSASPLCPHPSPF